MITPIRRFHTPGVTRRRALIKGLVDSSQISLLQGDRAYSFDANTALSDGLAAIAASGYAQYGGSDGIVDLGGNQNTNTYLLPSIADVQTLNTQNLARMDAVCVVDVTAVTATGTALEKLIVVGSNDPAFGSGKSVQLGMMEFGAAASVSQPNGLATAAPPTLSGSRYEIPFTNQQNNVAYQYVKLYVVIANSGSITFRAGIAVLPAP